MELWKWEPYIPQSSRIGFVGGSLSWSDFMSTGSWEGEKGWEEEEEEEEWEGISFQTATNVDRYLSGLSSELSALMWVGRRKKKVERKEVLSWWSHFFLTERVQVSFTVSRYSLGSDVCVMTYSRCSIPTRHTHTLRRQCRNRHFLSLTTFAPLPASHFHSLSKDPSVSPQFVLKLM